VVSEGAYNNVKYFDGVVEDMDKKGFEPATFMSTHNFSWNFFFFYIFLLSLQPRNC